MVCSKQLRTFIDASLEQAVIFSWMHVRFRKSCPRKSRLVWGGVESSLQQETCGGLRPSL